MKFSAVSITLVASTALASPIAIPEAAALAAPHFKSWWKQRFGGSGSSNNGNNNNSNNNGNTNNNNNQIINRIYIIPGGALISGNATSVPSSSVPFTGVVAGDRLYANSPSVGNIGTVVISSDGKLNVVPNDSQIASQVKWESNNGTLSPNGANVVSCPDDIGRTYLFAGVSCPGAHPISIKTNKEDTHLAYLSPI